MDHYDSCRDPDQAYKDNRRKFNLSKATKAYIKQSLKDKTAVVTVSKSKKSKKKLTIKQLAKLHREQTIKELNKLIKEELDILYKVSTEELDLLIHYEPKSLAETILQTTYTQDDQDSS